ncbi:hypothetical protein [Streptomyces clavuligerus]|uniref:hypothetical protein n=1 Tax=Streptomyces clavuligerus TaxID=1901 RepID=UPI0001851B35|nr:hypothetical protein [Streptomyces clavuligerus]ANW19387.1 hypothetical protein BB341_14745 [Streptomyces clavuligerus]WDN52745.1 hypothetical protein LL058_13275 [Streptomyces clavuligerus]
MRDWYFNLVLDAPLTEEQKDTLDGLDRFGEGGVGLAERPGHSRFTCAIPADTLTAAVADALSRFDDFPGVLVRSVEIDHFDLASNDMATPAMLPAPPPPGSDS